RHLGRRHVDDDETAAAGARAHVHARIADEVATAQLDHDFDAACVRDRPPADGVLDASAIRRLVEQVDQRLYRGDSFAVGGVIVVSYRGHGGPLLADALVRGCRPRITKPVPAGEGDGGDVVVA